MVETDDFGGLIRRSRERLGLSQSRVAELIGRSQGTVRAWERGRAVPGEETVVASLAAVLDIEEGDLFSAAGLPPPASPPVQTLEESLASIAPPAGGPNGEADAEPTHEARQRSAVTTEMAERSADTWAASIELKGLRGRLESFLSGALSRRTSPPPSTAGRPAVVPIPAGRPSYVEDPEQRMVYRLRTLLTVVGIVILAVVLLWAGGNVMDALGEAWATLTEGL